jgi:hypothetical protein
MRNLSRFFLAAASSFPPASRPRLAADSFYWNQIPSFATLTRVAFRCGFVITRAITQRVAHSAQRLLLSPSNFCLPSTSDLLSCRGHPSRSVHHSQPLTILSHPSQQSSATIFRHMCSIVIELLSFHLLLSASVQTVHPVFWLLSVNISHLFQHLLPLPDLYACAVQHCQLVVASSTPFFGHISFVTCSVLLLKLPR